MRAWSASMQTATSSPSSGRTARNKATIHGASRVSVSYTHLDVYKRQELKTPEEVLRQHRELAAQHGHQADKVVAEARQQGQRHANSPDKAAQVSVTYARDHLFERSAVESERSIMTAAVSYTHLDVYKRQLLTCVSKFPSLA